MSLVIDFAKAEMSIKQQQSMKPYPKPRKVILPFHPSRLRVKPKSRGTPIMNQVILYQSEDGRTKLDVRLENQPV
jgi:hypothetical protein